MKKALVIAVIFTLSIVIAPSSTRAQSTSASAPADKQAAAPTVKRTVLLQHDTSAPGFEELLVSVEIPVGGREGRHTHPGLAMVHVLEGTLSLDYEGKPQANYKTGDSFFVEAGKVHEGINKGTVPVRAVATFVIPKGQPVTTAAAK